jgi:hypothetical protein
MTGLAAAVVFLLATVAGVISAVRPVAPPPIVPASTNPAGTGCVTNQLRLTVAPGSNAAGHIGLAVEFRNTSGRACTLLGYPEVSFQTDSGARIGSPAQPSAAQGTPAPVSLAARGGTAHANLLLVNVSNYPATACDPVTATTVTITVRPGLTGPVAISPEDVCSAAGVGVAQVSAVQAGP